MWTSKEYFSHLTIKEVPVSVIRNFIETNHYSKSINGCKVSNCYALYYDEELVGSILFGGLSTTAWKKYSDKESDVVELRRLTCLDSCPRNTESWFLSRCIKLLKKESQYKIIVSYADPYHDHVGIIYQASNWSYRGTTNKDTLLKTPDGKLYHSRAMRTKYNGKLKPFAQRLCDMHEQGVLEIVQVPGKHIYTYNLIGIQEPTKLPYPK
jgi:hypothetical protein